MCPSGRGHHEETLLYNYFVSRPVVQEEMSVKDISYLELWWPRCLTEQNHVCPSGRVNHEETLLYNYFVSRPVVHDNMLLKDVSYLKFCYIM